jgi:hypothetical protein
MLRGGPPAHVGGARGDQLQRGRRPMELIWLRSAPPVSTCGGVRMSNAARASCGSAWRVARAARQRGDGGWAAREQRRDHGGAFGDLLEVELVSREVLPQSAQGFRAIVAGERGGQLLLRSVATAVARDANCWGSRTPARLAWRILSPLTPVRSLTTV